MRLIDADALKRKEQKIATETWKMKVKASVESILNQFIDHIDHAPAVCCETCKHGIKGEHIGGREYVCCTKPYAELSNYHPNDWVCGDWRNKDALD